MNSLVESKTQVENVRVKENFEGEFYADGGKLFAIFANTLWIGKSKIQDTLCDHLNTEKRTTTS